MAYISLSETGLDPYDVVVAGAGLAAYALSDRLSAAGRRVLILETGFETYDPEVQARFTRMEARGHFSSTYWPRHWVRAFGGTSAVWAGYCLPLSERNFRDWPIGRADLDPHYATAARLLRRPLPFLAYSAPFLRGFTYRPMSLEPPLNLAAEPELVTDLTGVDIALGATLAGLTPATDRRSVRGATIHLAGPGERRDFPLASRQRLVLAAGGIGNAQILLNSTDGSSAAVGNAADRVGRHLMEHPHAYDCGRIVAGEDLVLPDLPEGFGFPLPSVEPDTALFGELGGHDVALDLVDSALAPEDPVERFVAERIGANARAFTLTARTEMPADPENRVTLTEGRDPSGMRRVRASCAIPTEALRAIEHCLEALSGSLGAAGAARLRIVNAEIYRNATGGGHIMGTTRMGSDPRDSVVDADCRVHGYENLFVAGSSVFASGGYANPTLTLMALAARLGETLGRAA
ncbi:MAG: GMC family oxidoreductase [Paracoccaceae bacterium]|nr:GMC family oxidoreductase [Paracoccaceae bacterium]